MWIILELMGNWRYTFSEVGFEVKKKEHGKYSYVSFVELLKAFDSTPRDVLFTPLKKFGVPLRMLDVIQRMHQDAVVRIMVRDIKTTVSNEGGVKQSEN